jgi:hypothetical protein
MIFSSQAAGWFDEPSVKPSTSPEYVYLAHQTDSTHIEDWLMKRDGTPDYPAERAAEAAKNRSNR